MQIEEENINLNKIINNKNEEKKDNKEVLPGDDININSLEFKNFCNDLSAKLFGNKI